MRRSPWRPWAPDAPPCMRTINSTVLGDHARGGGAGTAGAPLPSPPSAHATRRWRHAQPRRAPRTPIQLRAPSVLRSGARSAARRASPPPPHTAPSAPRAGILATHNKHKYDWRARTSRARSLRPAAHSRSSRGKGSAAPTLLLGARRVLLQGGGKFSKFGAALQDDILLQDEDSDCQPLTPRD